MRDTTASTDTGIHRGHDPSHSTAAQASAASSSHVSYTSATSPSKRGLRKAHYLRPVLLSLTVLCILSITLGAGMNDLNQKYVRALPNGDCARVLLITSVPDSTLCCESGLHEKEWVCAAAYDPINRILSSLKAYWIPLVPVLLTFVSDMILNGGKAFEGRVLIGMFLRMLLYALVFAFRLVSPVPPPAKPAKLPSYVIFVFLIGLTLLRSKCYSSVFSRCSALFPT
jgi:hypothetical protein